MFVEGEGGIGKSRLVDEAVERARQQGFTDLMARASELEQARPLGAMRGLLGRAGRHAAQRDEGTSTETAFRMVDAVVDAVEAAAVHSPVALVVDDLQWADPSTLAAVDAIARLPFVPVALLLTMRPTPRSGMLDGLVDRTLGRGGRHVALGPLDDDAVRELVRVVAGREPGPGLLAQAARGAGNPFFVVQLVEALRAERAIIVEGDHADVVGATLPPSLRRTVLRRLSMLPDECIHALRLAAVLGSGFAVDELSALAQRSVSGLLDELADAVAAGVVEGAGERLVFRHELIREAVYEDMPLPVRRAIHAEAAGALARLQREPSRVAAQLVLAGDAAAADALPWLRRAAADAAHTAPATAIELLERALRLAGPDGGERDELLLAQLWCHAALGHHAECVRAAQSLLSHQLDPVVEGRVRSCLGLVYQRAGTLLTSAEEFERAAAVTGIPDAHRSDYLADAATTRLLLGQPGSARALADEAIALSRPADGTGALCEALNALSWVALAEGDVTEGRQLAERSMRLRDTGASTLGGQPMARLHLGAALLEADLFEDADATLRAGFAEAESAGCVAQLPWYHALIALAGYHAGRWDDALAEAEAGLGAADDVGTRVSLPLLAGVAALVHVHRGELVEARARLELGGRPPRWFGEEWPAIALAALSDAEGDVAGALSLCTDAWEHDCRYLLAWRTLAPALVRHAVQAGASDVARSVARAASRGADLAPDVASAVGAGHWCEGLAAADLDHLLAAVEAYRRSGRVFDGAAVCEDAAHAQHLAGGTAEATALFEEALDGYEAVGAQPLIARARAGLRRLGVRRASRAPLSTAKVGWESLTPTERRVVDLASEGLSNTQIGRRLYVSSRTVQTHLAHVFAKLGINSRVELAALAARTGQGSLPA